MLKYSHMKDASQYKITFPYGAVDDAFYGKGGSIGPTHRGEDRAMPKNTPIIINGNTTIGFSGNTGASSAPHLHIGRFVNGQATNPNGRGFTLKAPAKVTGVFEDATNGKYVTINDADGVRWVYLHLNSQTATIGQIIKEEDNDMPRRPIDPATVREHYQNYAGITLPLDSPNLQNRFEDPNDDEFWRGLVPMMNDIRLGQGTAIERLNTELAKRDMQILDLATQLEMKNEALSQSIANATTSIEKAKATAPSATKSNWFVKLVAALSGKK